MHESPPRSEYNQWANVGWLGKAALAFSGTFIAIGLFAVGAALPALQSDFHGGSTVAFVVQMVGGIVAPVFALSSPIAGKLVSRYGERNIYLASLAIFIIGGTGPAICSSLVEILLFRVLLGVGVAGAFTAGMSGIARLPESQRHFLYGFTSFIGGGICILAYPVVGILAKEGWRLAFLIHLILLPTALLAVGLPGRRKDSRVAVKVAASATRLGGGVPFRLLALATVIGWSMVGSTLYSPFLLASLGVSDPASVGTILGIAALCSLVGSGSYGFVQKLVGTRGMLLAAPVMAGTGCLVVAFSTIVPIAVVGFGFLAVGLALFGAAGYASAAEAIGPGGDSGAATGIVSLALYFPQVLFALLASPLGERFGPSKVYLLLAILLTCTLILISLRSPRDARRSGDLPLSLDQ